MFENKMIEGIYYSRFVASWINAGGARFYKMQCRRLGFEIWLKQLVINGRHLTEEEIRDICNYAWNGKLELEENVRNFLINVEES